MSVPLNLEALYGDRFRVFMSEDHEPGQHRDPWNFELRNVGGRGRIWPYGRNVLVAYTDRPLLMRRLIAIPGVTIQQRGTDEVMVQFRPGTETEKAVFALIQPTRRRPPPSKPFLSRGSRLERGKTTLESIGAENPVDTPSDEAGVP